MIKKTLIITPFLLLIFCGYLFPQNIPNPVLPGVADAGVIKYNGKYYIGGVFTNGDFYISKDLINWEGPVHVLSMDNDWTRDSGAGNDQIHANDMIYLNGKFHFYWSVNYWGKDKHAVHISHAEADNILGPYNEPEKATWMDNRIDPMVFRDDDGKLYMYMVRFTDGNTIWGRPMKAPASFDGPPVCLFASLPDTWETMDNRVAEGPWVIKYRNRYYMIYNANHTGTQWGNYQLGVAEADSPLAFNHGNKYSHPVVLSNQMVLEDEYADLLRYGKGYDPLFVYALESPQGNWKSPGYDDSSWKKGQAGFASNKVEGSTVRYSGTEWTTPDIWLRKPFFVKDAVENLGLRVAHDGDTKIYLNEKLIYEKTGTDYCIINLDKKQLSLIKNGENILAIESSKGRRSNFLDVALFDLKENKADDILFTPGQPNIVRGPNGFEWWLVYMANKNKERRGQYINRIHFFNKTMHVDGITSSNTPGYFPYPAKPTYGELFDDNQSWKDNWTISHPDNWSVSKGELQKTGSNSSYALVKNHQPAISYLYETNLSTDKEAGIFAWWKDENNWLKIGMDAVNNNFYTTTCLEGKQQKSSYPLNPDFKFGVYHKLTVERDGKAIRLKLDGIPVPGNPDLSNLLPAHEKGIPGLYAEAGNTSFDGIIYTIGWDESDNDIRGWQDSEKGNKQQGEYVISSGGIQVKSLNDFQAFKGDLLNTYEYSLQLSALSDKGTSGVYPVYVDEKNYVKAGINMDTRSLDITVVKNGKQVKSLSHALQQLQTLYTDVKYTDNIEKGYTFQYPSCVNEIWLNRHDIKNKDIFVDNMFDKFIVEYQAGGKWYPLPDAKVTTASNLMYNVSSFNQVKAEALRFINKEPEDLDRHIYKIRIHELCKESYNVRTVKLKDKVLIFLDGKQICSLDVSYPEAQVGIYSTGAMPSFNGIMRYHIH